MSAAPRKQTDFAIAIELLSDAAAPLAWANLGDWSAARDYLQAGRALALRVGTAAQLRAQDRVLDMACGHGASLRLWPEVFGVQHVTGIEYQARCVEHIRRQPPPGLEAILHARFDEWPASAALPGHTFDAALCVDAAYHAQSLQAFAAFAFNMLRPRGRLAFTTLLASPAWAQSPRHQKQSLLFLLARAGIPAASVLAEDEIVETLTRQGFSGIRIERLDAEVLRGFAAFVQHRRRELPWREKIGAGWLKIEATAWLCRHLYQSGTLHYCLISATRTSTAADSVP